jgi:hypothetical protein
MCAYIVLSLLIGSCTEELRALHWREVDLDGRPDAHPPVPPSIAVYRACSRLEGGDSRGPRPIQFGAPTWTKRTADP